MAEVVGAAGQPTASSSQALLLPSLGTAVASLDWLQDWTVTARLTLAGYQLWAVEQWVTDRASTLPVIVVFTGDTNDTISVDRFSPSSTSSHNSKERLWDQAKLTLRSTGAKLTQARGESGWIGLTSLPSLNPNLSIVHLPSGNYQEAMPLLYVNINLRRLGLGGRSGLRLTPATPAQQLHLRQAFRLPIPAPSFSHHQQPTSFSTGSGTSSVTPVDSSSPFIDTLLSLIQLTQHALSLFGLGIVRVPLRSTGPEAPPSVPASEEHADALGSHLPSSRLLTTGDGLLCDTTLAALSYFRFEIAEPLVRLPRGEESVLSSSLLSALLSIICGAKRKMQAMGVDVPRDPIERRGKFLSAVSSFAKQHRLPSTSYLNAAFLLSLAQLHHSHLHPSSTLNPVTNLNTQRRRGAQKVSRALRNRLGDDGAAGVGEEGEVETASLEKLVADMGRGLGGATMQRLWGMEGKEGRRERRRESKERAKERKEMERGREKTDGEVEEENKAGTASDGETLGGEGGGVLGIGRGVLKGVKERAGRAGRKFGDNLGFTDAHYSMAPTGPAHLDSTSATAPAPHKLAPSLLISGAASAPTSRSRSLSPIMSRSATLEASAPDPNALAPAPTNMTAATSSSGNTTSGPSSKAAAFAARVASALSSEGAATGSGRGGSAGNRVERKSGSSKSASVSRSASRVRGVPFGGTAADSLESLPVTRMPPVRRSATEVAGGITRFSPPAVEGRDAPSGGYEQDDSTSDSDEEGLGEDEVVVAEGDAENDRLDAIGRAGGTMRRSRRSSKKVSRRRDMKRRHSFNIVQDAPEPWLNLSRKRLVLDVNLRMTYWTLYQKEKQLAEMVEALKTVNSSYDQALASLQPLLAAKTARLDSLTSTATTLSAHAESYSSPTSPLSKLSVGSSRLLYAQSVVEEKLGDVTDFSGIVQGKVGPGGTLEQGTRELGAERMGVRKLVKSVERWRVWLAGLAFGGLRRPRLD